MISQLLRGEPEHRFGVVKGDAADQVSAAWTKHIYLPHACGNPIILRLCDSTATARP
jgi:hypothetical protein